MADNVTVPATGTGTATPVIATDDVAGVHYQRVKLVNGALDATDAIGGDASNGLDVDVTRVPAPLSTTGGGTEASALRVTVASDSTGVLSVDDNGAALTVDNGGTFAVQVDGAALTALQLIDDAVFADDAAFTIGTSKVLMGGKAVVAHGSNPDAADAGDGGAPIMNRHRVPFFVGGHPNVVTVKHANITTAVTDTAIVTVGSGAKIVVTAFTVTLDNASTVYPTVLMGFGATTTPTTTGVIAAHGGVPAGGGFSRGDGSGIIGIGGDGEDLRITTTGNATGNGLQVVVTYYTIES